jgi:hypothetical protein
MMSPAEQQEFAALKAQVETLLTLLAAAGEYAGVNLTPPSVSRPEVPALRLLPGGRGDTKRVAGGVSRVTPSGVPRHATTSGRAS